jgi:hypothetical protein
MKLGVPGLEVLRAVVTKSSVLWDMTSCSTLKVVRRFGGTCWLTFNGIDYAIITEDRTL